MQETIFRQPPRARFTINQAALIALVLLLSLIWWAESSHMFFLRLSPEELARMESEHSKRREDLVFRFLDAPRDEEKPDNARFFSDADRLRKSAPVENPQEDNPDPTSEGNTFELTQGTVIPPSGRTQETQQALESPESAPQDEIRDEPETADDRATPERPDVPVDPSAPQPYRRPTEEEVALARKMALEQLTAKQQRGIDVIPRDARQQYDNPMGSRAERLGFSVDTAGHDLGPYLKKLIQLVRGNWRIPEIARYEVSGVAVIAFKLHQDGTITNTLVLESSQHEPLDVASFNAINTIYKAPPLPDHITEPFIPIRFAFYYNMRPRY